MTELAPINPKPFLRELIDRQIVVALKFNKTQYRGTLVSTDNYFNVQLRGAEEFIDGTSRGVLGDVFVRCNNVLWIGEAEPEQATEQATEQAAEQTTAPVLAATTAPESAVESQE
ncbi:LAMI_0E05204g1_1 [Lachancea mirantina]|uniref:Sm protein F n=1 Tax=Lachancea mirantina TaxID=1230905 RepID=A0A1G4JL32_9SACH|nr:LAMI_0E05204g1_1 [Lachancea mirantina]